MKKIRKIRVAVAYSFLKKIGNIKIYIPICGHGYGFQLYQCSQCEQLMVIDLEDPRLVYNEYEKRIKSGPCPNCGREMGGDLLKYPSEFCAKGRRGNFVVPQISDEMRKEEIEVYELNSTSEVHQ